MFSNFFVYLKYLDGWEILRLTDEISVRRKLRAAKFTGAKLLAAKFSAAKFPVTILAAVLVFIAEHLTVREYVKYLTTLESWGQTPERTYDVVTYYVVESFRKSLDTVSVYDEKNSPIT